MFLFWMTQSRPFVFFGVPLACNFPWQVSFAFDARTQQKRVYFCLNHNLAWGPVRNMPQHGEQVFSFPRQRRVFFIWFPGFAWLFWNVATFVTCAQARTKGNWLPPKMSSIFGQTKGPDSANIPGSPSRVPSSRLPADAKQI